MDVRKSARKAVMTPKAHSFRTYGKKKESRVIQGEKFDILAGNKPLSQLTPSPSSSKSKSTAVKGPVKRHSNRAAISEEAGEEKENFAKQSTQARRQRGRNARTPFAPNSPPVVLIPATPVQSSRKLRSGPVAASSPLASPSVVISTPSTPRFTPPQMPATPPLTRSSTRSGLRDLTPPRVSLANPKTPQLDFTAPVAGIPSHGFGSHAHTLQKGSSAVSKRDALPSAHPSLEILKTPKTPRSTRTASVDFTTTLAATPELRKATPQRDSASQSKQKAFSPQKRGVKRKLLSDELAKTNQSDESGPTVVSPPKQRRKIFKSSSAASAGVISFFPIPKLKTGSESELGRTGGDVVCGVRIPTKDSYALFTRRRS